MHYSGNLSLTKISLNMFVKDFKHLSPPVLNNSIATPEAPLVKTVFKVYEKIKKIQNENILNIM